MVERLDDSEELLSDVQSLVDNYGVEDVIDTVSTVCTKRAKELSNFCDISNATANKRIANLIYVAEQLDVCSNLLISDVPEDYD